MTGKKDKRAAKGKDKNKDKASGKRDGRKNDDGQAKITRAEKALAKALRTVEQAREQLNERERELTRLMAKYGRLPDQGTSDEAIEVELPQSFPMLDQHQATPGALLVDGRQRETAVSEVGADITADQSGDDNGHESETDTVALFDQQQVVRHDPSDLANQ